MPAERIVGVDFGVTKIGAALAESDGTRVREIVLDTDADEGAEQALGRAVAAIRDLSADEDLLSVAVAAPGAVRDDGIRLAPTVPGWEELDLTARLRSELGIDRISVCNDVKAVGLAEARWGSLAEVDPGIVLHLGRGLAAALVIDGKVVTGAHGAAGKTGYSLHGDHQARYARGHAPLEDFIFGRVGGDRESVLLSKKMSAAEVFLAACEDDRARELVRDALRALAIQVANLAIAVDPARIALVGGLAARAQLIIPALVEVLDEAVLFPPEVVVGRFATDAPLVGAIAHAIDSARRDRRVAANGSPCRRRSARGRGEQMAAEMAEQPTRLCDLIERSDAISNQARALAGGIRGITTVARGSSDHAATFGRYLLEFATGLNVSPAAPSVHTLYGADVDYRGQLAVAVSQSGQTPEIVATLRQLREAGARGMAITNDSASELAGAADAVIDLGVGEERAVPATKTVTAQFMTFAILAAALGPVPFSPEHLAAVPDAVAWVLANPAPATQAAEALADASRLIVVARGVLLGAAKEAALKLKETCSVLAEGYSAADLRHGPLAAVTAGTPVLAIHAPGPAAQDVQELIAQLTRRGAQMLTMAPDATADLPLPGHLPEALIAIPALIRAQQLAHALALRVGHDPDRPDGLSKVTAT